ncbi:sickle tail protein homolog isoform X4 [Pleurodeles waltl]|uniref:sickle tail protein homolog isoform X4 n=1 Tax=Pleurodeles waltl TaxID=8319 RepID=UPI003709C50C
MSTSDQVSNGMGSQKNTDSLAEALGTGDSPVILLDDGDGHSSKEHVAKRSSHVPPKSSRGIPRRHTVGGPRTSQEILGMQSSDMDRKREAFLEHLKQKYPHHATAIMGHQERLRDQAVSCMLTSLHSELDIQRYLLKIESSQRTRSPKPSQSPQPTLGDQAEHLSEVSADSLEAMSEGGDSPTPFLRGSRTRASLPVVRSTNQTKERSLGVLFLQYGDHIKQLRMPNEITSTDTIRALFVSAFPQLLNMKVLESPNVAIYIKDESRNIYYELTDVRSIQDQCLLKLYNKDPAQAFSHTPRPVNGDIRMQKEITYTGREGPPLHRTGSATHPHVAPNSPPPLQISHSMPPSPSRIPYGGARPLSGQGNTAIPKERLANMPASRSISPSPSAILERRDVKPDEDLSNKNVQLLRNEGMYADPYMFHEGRMSVASSHTGHPLDIPDHIFAYHRGAMRSSSTYSSSTVQSEMMEQSMYRQKSRKYTDSHLPSLGSKTPPSSPHRMTDLRMTDIHTHNPHMPPHSIQTDRSSPIRQSFKKDSGSPVFIETTMTKARNVSGLQTMVDVVPSPTEKQTLIGYGPAAPPKETYSRERMQAMEKQIASLTGLVQSALMKGPSPATETTSEKMTKTAPSGEIGGGKNSSTIIESTTIVNHLHPASSLALQVSLHDMRRNVSDLKLQLLKMKQLQLQNQDTLRAMMKKTEMEINSRVIEAVKRLEDPVQRQRVLVEQERQNYLHEEETLVKRICDLEGFVDDLKKDSSSVNKGVTLKDVEDGAFSLRQIGEAVANLKGAFPPLQNKMRAVLRVEVEAVRFLKEEPHKLDSLLKRIRMMTDSLTALRRHVTEGVVKGTDLSHKVQYTTREKSLELETLRSHDEVARMQSISQQNSAGIAQESKTASMKPEPFHTMTVHHVQSSPVIIHQSQHSTALVNHVPSSPATPCNAGSQLTPGDQLLSTPLITQESAVVIQQTQTAQSPPVSLNGSATQGFFINEMHHASFRNRAVSIEEAEKKWEEKRQNLDHYNGKEFEKLLEEAQANIMKSIPNLEVPSQVPKMESVEKLEVFEDPPDAEQENDNVMKSPPPPPPPRRIYPPGSGLATARPADIPHSVKKDPSKELNDDINSPSQSKFARCQTEDQISHPKPPVATDSTTKDDEEQEGERIMAELQAFQKCSYIETPSKGHAEQSRVENQTKDTRPVGLIHPKEKKNLEFFQEETLKHDDGYEKSSSAEYTGDIYHVFAGTGHSTNVSLNAQQKDEDQIDKNKVLDTATFERRESPSLVPESSILSKSMLIETEEESKNLITCKTPSGDSFAIETSKSREGKEVAPYRIHSPAIENEKSKINYRVSSVVGQTISQTELRIVDGQTKIGDIASTDHNNEESKIEELLLASKSLRERELPFLDHSQQVVLRPKASRNRNVHNNEDASSPCNSPTDNIAFMITQNEVQVLSSGEVHDIVSRQGDDVQTVNIDARADKKHQDGVIENKGNEDPVLCMDKKPVIIIFDEPMDIRSAYKRLSTIFEECEEEFERMISGEKILEEDEDEDEDSEMSSASQDKTENPKDHRLQMSNQNDLKFHSSSNPLKSHNSVEEMSKKHFRGSEDIHSDIKDDSPDYQFAIRDDAKKKFKFKFPKKQLAALTQAIRTGTKTGKKTLQVVVYEEEEEPDGTVKQHKEAKRFEIARSKSKEETDKNTLIKEQQGSETAGPAARTDEIRQNTYRTLNSLEQTIKQLENTISEMSPKVVSENMGCIADSASLSPTSIQANNVLKQDEPKSLVEPPSSIPSAPRKVSTGSSQTSRMPVPMASKSRPQASVDKTAKQPKLQEPQRQYRQANGGTKKTGGDFKAASPTLTSSRIPAFSPSSGKSSSLPAYCGESPNTLSPSTKSPVSPSNPISPQAGRTINSSSFIPSIPNGSSKHQSPTYTGKGHQLSFSPQASNGRPTLSSSSSSSPTTPTSPPSLGQGMKNVRTIHTPNFTSYKSQNGNTRKTTTTATTKEAS